MYGLPRAEECPHTTRDQTQSQETLPWVEVYIKAYAHRDGMAEEAIPAR